MLALFFQGRYGYYSYCERKGQRAYHKSQHFDHVKGIKVMICNLLELYHLTNIIRKDSVYLRNNLQWWADSPLVYCRTLIDRVTNISFYLHDLVSDIINGRAVTQTWKCT